MPLAGGLCRVDSMGGRLGSEMPVTGLFRDAPQKSVKHGPESIGRAVGYHEAMRKVAGARLGLLMLTCCMWGRDYGPPAGSKMDFELQDQDGKTHSLKSLLGPKGAAILFYRSADW